MQRRRSSRLGVTIGVALGTVLAFAAIGGTGLAGGLAKPAKSQYGPGQYQYGKKVTVCHKGKVTIRISINAWKAHKAHGDSLGPCTTASVKAAKAKAAKTKATKAAKTKAAKAAKESAKQAASSSETDAQTSVSSEKVKPAKPQKPAKGSKSGDAADPAAPSAPGNGNGNGKAKGHDKG
jgi:hypothetical protein